MSAPERPPFNSDLEEPLKQSPGTPIFKKENFNEAWILSDSIPAKTMLGGPELNRKDITVPCPGAVSSRKSSG
jgi:hypothetical protein